MNRKSRRATEKAAEKARKLMTTKASIETYSVGMTADVVVKCGRCRGLFRMPYADERTFTRIDETQGPATTGPFFTGACPHCGFAHRIRMTTFVLIEEEVDERKSDPVSSPSQGGDHVANDYSMSGVQPALGNDGSDDAGKVN